MRIASRDYELEEYELIKMFGLCPKEEIETLRVWYDKPSNKWFLHAVITEVSDEDRD